MKLNIISLIFIFLNLNFCVGQEVNKKTVKIHSVIDSVKCNNEKYYFEFPDVFGENEINFFNNSITIDYLNYLDIETKNIKPKDLINMVIDMRKKSCNKDNFNGFIGSNYKVTFNDSKILSITVDYQSLTGSINIDSYYYNFNVSNSKRILYTDIIKKNKIKVLVKMCNVKLKDRLDELLSENKIELEASDEYQSLIHSDYLFKEENLNVFSIQEKGIEYIFDYGFPNGMFAIENNIFISYDDLKMILKDDLKIK